MNDQFANVPLKWVGPVKITGPEIDVETELTVGLGTVTFAATPRAAQDIRRNLQVALRWWNNAAQCTGV